MSTAGSLRTGGIVKSCAVTSGGMLRKLQKAALDLDPQVITRGVCQILFDTQIPIRRLD